VPDLHLVTTDRFERDEVMAAEIDPLVAACAAAGIDARPVVWHDPSVDWGAAPLTVVRTPWDYPRYVDAFLDWADAVAARAALHNPAPVLRWNSHKAYLLDLEGAGVAVVPCTIVGPSRTFAFPSADRVVVKPAVGSGARGAELGALDDDAFVARIRERAVTEDLVISAYVESVETEGETSTIWIGGEPSHALRKVPAPGDFRVHQQYGGRAEAVAPDACRSVLDAVAARFVLDGPLLYARVDTVLIGDVPHVMELELIEPAFYLPEVPAAAARFATACERVLESP